MGADSRSPIGTTALTQELVAGVGWWWPTTSGRVPTSGHTFSLAPRTGFQLPLVACTSAAHRCGGGAVKDPFEREGRRIGHGRRFEHVRRLGAGITTECVNLRCSIWMTP